RSLGVLFFPCQILNFAVGRAILTGLDEYASDAEAIFAARHLMRKTHTQLLRSKRLSTEFSCVVTRSNVALQSTTLCISSYKFEIRGSSPCAIFQPNNTHLLKVNSMK